MHHATYLNLLDFVQQITCLALLQEYGNRGMMPCNILQQKCNVYRATRNEISYSLYPFWLEIVLAITCSKSEGYLLNFKCKNFLSVPSDL